MTSCVRPVPWRDVDPRNLVRIPLDFGLPVAGGRHAEGDGRQVLGGRVRCLLGLVVNRDSRSFNLDGREVKVGFLLLAARENGGRRGKERKEACSDIHKTQYWLFSFTVERIQVGLAGNSLRGVAPIVHQLAEDDDVVAHLDVGLAGLELLVAESVWPASNFLLPRYRARYTWNSPSPVPSAERKKDAFP